VLQIRIAGRSDRDILVRLGRAFYDEDGFAARGFVDEGRRILARDI
jgi:hypothetical protein